MHLILEDKEEINSEIKDLKELSTQEKRSYIVFDKKDVTLKINIDEVEMIMTELEYYSKVDVKVNNKIQPGNIIKILEHIPSNLAVRLEADNIDLIIKLMNSEILIEKLKEQGIKFLLKGIEIEPRIIENKMDEDNLKNEVTEIKAKRWRMNMDWDK